MSKRHSSVSRTGYDGNRSKQLINNTIASSSHCHVGLHSKTVSGNEQKLSGKKSNNQSQTAVFLANYTKAEQLEGKK